MNAEQRRRLLSELLDDASTSPESILPGMSDDMRRELDALRSVKGLLARTPRLAEDPGFADRLDARLRAGTEHPRLQPFAALPRFAVAAIAVFLLAVVAGSVYLKRRGIAEMFTRTSRNVAEAYEHNPIRSWMMPLFAKTNRDRALQFAMYGTLPLDDSAHAVLHVDNSQPHGYRIELGPGPRKRTAPVSAEDLYRDVGATENQRRVIDSVLRFAQERIESSVLLSTDKTVAVSPAISKLSQAILTMVASSLEPQQRERMIRFLDERNTPYALVADRPIPPAPPEAVLHRIRAVPEPRQFVIFENNGAVLAHVAIDIDSLRLAMERTVVEHAAAAREYEELAVRLEGLARSYAEQHVTVVERNRAATGYRVDRAVTVYGDSGCVGISIPSRRSRDDAHRFTLRVQPRELLPQIVSTRGGVPNRLHIRVDAGKDGDVDVDVNVEQLLQKALDAIPDFEMRLYDESDSVQPPPPARTPRPPDQGTAPSRKELQKRYEYWYREGASSGKKPRENRDINGIDRSLDEGGFWDRYRRFWTERTARQDIFCLRPMTLPQRDDPVPPDSVRPFVPSPPSDRDSTDI